MSGTPLTGARRRFWLAEQLTGPAPESTVTVVVEVAAALDPDRLTSTLRTVLARHPVLRTRVGMGPDGEPTFDEDDPGTFACSVVTPGPDDRVAGPDEWYRRLAAERDARVTGLGTGPLVELTLARWSPDRSALVLTLVHAVTDGQTNVALVAELCAAYDGVALLPATRAYEDVAVAGPSVAGRRAAATARDVEYLDGAPAGNGLPLRGEGAVAWSEALLPPAATERLRGLARDHRTTPFAVLLAVVVERLAAAAGRADVVAGIAVDEREELDAAGVVGPFVNMAPCRFRLDGADRVAGAVAAARDRLVELIDGGAAPYETLLAAVRARDPRFGDALFDVLVTYVAGGLQRLTIAGHRARLVPVPMATLGVPLTVAIGSDDDGWSVAAVARGDGAAAFCGWLTASIESVLTTGDPGPAGECPLAVTPDREPDERPALAADDEVCRVLCESWARVLGVPVTADDNVFALGADSLTVARACAAARQQGVTVSARDVMRHPAIRDLVATGRYVRTAPQETTAEPAAASPSVYPMAQAQLGMVYATERDPALSLYCAAVRADCRGAWDAAAFREAVTAVAGRHPMLRTSFGLSGRAPTQHVHLPGPVTVDVVDATGLPDDQRERAVEDAVDAALHARYRWFRPPLVTYRVVVTEADAFTLVVACHHSALDGQSERLVAEEIVTTYERLLAGDRTERAPLRTDVAAYVEAEQAALADVAQQGFWAAEVSSIRALPPAAKAEPRVHPLGNPVIRTLDPGVVAGLRARVTGLERPVKSLLIAAHCAALASVAGQDEVVTGLAAYNRLVVPDGDLVLGNFVNMVPFRVRLTGALADDVTAVYEREAELTQFSRVPLAAIQRMAPGARLFTTSLSYTRFDSTPVRDASRVRIASLGSAMLSEDPFHVNFNEDLAAGTLVVRLRYLPGHPDLIDVVGYTDALDAALAAAAS